jgi:glycosyltransferase involved in cell wall biosynthesis
MVDLLEDDELRSRMGRAAHERVRDRFLTTRELEDYCRLLSEVR